MSPLLSNVALSALDEYIARAPGGHSDCRNDRVKRRRRGLPNFRLIRYADDWCLMVSGSQSDAEALMNEIADVLSTLGLRLSEEKTLITHIEEGLDFLGWRIQRHRKRGTNRHYVYTYPSRKAVQAAMAKVKEQCRKTGTNPALDALLIPINWMLRGWCAFFRPGVSSTAFHYLSHFARDRVIRWLRKKHPRTNWKELRRRYGGGRWWPTGETTELFNPAAVHTTRYRYRGAVIPSPWPLAG
ncbi:group II intron maturase-specific domain-containing protein [Streptomyces sp. NPDC005096]|uniref:group II intron maturase-specific domain-containing protein n=1 Tax=Streptomyces sp. NPDC005096 TaxID=3154559 RepID=UPI0033B64E69